MPDKTDTDNTTAKPQIADSEPSAPTAIDTFLLSGQNTPLIDFSAWASKEPTWEAYSFSLSRRERHAQCLRTMWEFQHPFPEGLTKERAIALCQKRSEWCKTHVQNILAYLDEHQPGWDSDPNWGRLHK